MPKLRGMKRWGLIVPALLLSSILLAACGNSNTPSILDTHGPVADKEAGLFWFILVVATIVFVAVEGVLITSIIRFRERPNAPAPRQIHGNNTIEIIWTVAPSLFLFAVLIGTIYTMFNLYPTSGAHPTVEIDVRGHQWWWEFNYTHEGIDTADELVVPINTPIHVTLHSNNVIHSFWVPQVTGKMDVVPGHDNNFTFIASDPGRYRALCTEYCGLQHAHMSFFLLAQPWDQYLSWVQGQQAKAQTPTDPNALAGQKIFTSSCQGCHGIVGVNLSSFTDPKASFLVGPNLTHFGSRRTIAGAVLQWDPNSCKVVPDSNGNPSIQNKDSCGLYQWLHDPQAVKPGNDMIIGQLSDTQIAQLVAYLESLT